MANTLMINVPENFNISEMGNKLRDSFMAKGFSVNVSNLNNGVRLQFEKGTGGINMLLGLGKGITAMCTVQGNNLIVNYSDGEWTSKIIGLAVGWLLCLIPFITAIVGCINQSQLPKEINNEIIMIAGC